MFTPPDSYVMLEEVWRITQEVTTRKKLWKIKLLLLDIEREK